MLSDTKAPRCAFCSSRFWLSLRPGHRDSRAEGSAVRDERSQALGMSGVWGFDVRSTTCSITALRPRSLPLLSLPPSLALFSLSLLSLSLSLSISLHLSLSTYNYVYIYTHTYIHSSSGWCCSSLFVLVVCRTDDSGVACLAS